jgi:NAD-dependent deacetylase
MMPYLAKESGALVVEINPEPTPLTGRVGDYLLRGPAGEVINAIVARIEALRGPAV